MNKMVLVLNNGGYANGMPYRPAGNMAQLLSLLNAFTGGVPVYDAQASYPSEKIDVSSLKKAATLSNFTHSDGALYADVSVADGYATTIVDSTTITLLVTTLTAPMRGVKTELVLDGYGGALTKTRVFHPI